MAGQPCIACCNRQSLDCSIQQVHNIIVLQPCQFWDEYKIHPQVCTQGPRFHYHGSPRRWQHSRLEQNRPLYGLQLRKFHWGSMEATRIPFNRQVTFCYDCLYTLKNRVSSSMKTELNICDEPWKNHPSSWFGSGWTCQPNSTSIIFMLL